MVGGKSGRPGELEEPILAPRLPPLPGLAGDRGGSPLPFGGSQRCALGPRQSLFLAPFWSKVKTHVKAWCLAPPCGQFKVLGLGGEAMLRATKTFSS